MYIFVRAYVVASRHVQAHKASGVKGVQVLGESREGTHMLDCRRLFVVARPASVTHMSTCMEAHIHSLITPKNILHTLVSYGLKENHWGCRLNLLSRMGM